MTTLTLQQAFEACQKNETAWLNRKAELAAAEQEYQEQVLAGDDRIPGRMQTLRDIIDVKKWEINQAAGRYIRSHEAVQRISIRNRLNDFMQAHGTELAATLAPELMGLSQQPALLTGHALDRSAHYLREALSVWLSTGEEINYAAEDSDILTAIGFRPDAASRVDNQEKYTPAQSLIYARRRTELASKVAPQKNPRKYCYFSRIKPCIHRVHGLACVSSPCYSCPAPVPARPEPPDAPA